MSRPLHVFLDTSVLTRAPEFDSAAIRSLEGLAVAGDVVVHVSTVTVREFVTKQGDEVDRAVGRAASSLAAVHRHLASGLPALEALGAAERAVGSLKLEIRGQVEAGLSAWIERTDTRLHDPKPGHLAPVIDNYFEGGPPFQKAKSRDDFPDAFIFESLKNTVHKPVHAVIEDRNLRECASQLPSVTVYEDLDAFIRSPAAQELIQDMAVGQNVQSLVERFAQQDSVLKDAVRSQLVDALAGREVESPAIPDDNNVATIETVDEAVRIGFAWSEAEYYGSGTIRLPFEAGVKVGVYCFIHKADYYSLSDERVEQISISDWNDHYYAAEETIFVEVDGALAISVDAGALAQSLDDEALAVLLRDPRISIDKVDEIRVLADE